MEVPLWAMSLCEQADGVRRGRFTSCELVAAHLARMDAVNPRVNAIAQRLDGAVMAAARAIDAGRARGLMTAAAPPGPLAGVPVSVKENVDVAGSATTMGMAGIPHAVPAADAPLVAALRSAGAVILARTNMPEMGLRWDTDGPLRGRTLNPRLGGVTAGGSGGGDAAAVATGMAAAGIGNDVGGSLRFPAQCCGVAGLRPTAESVPTGFNPATGQIPCFQMMLSHGPIARTIRDLRLVWRAVSLSSSSPAAPGTPRPAVAVYPPELCGDLDDECAAALRAAASHLADAGYPVEPVAFPRLDDAARTYARQLLHELGAAVVPAVGRHMSDAARRFLRLAGESVPPATPAEYVLGWVERSAWAWEVAQFQSRFPLILAPACTRAPFAIGADTRDAGSVAAIIGSMRFLTFANFFGLPAVTVPARAGPGLPQSAQLIGARGGDAACLDAAEEIERRADVARAPCDPVG